MPTGFQNMHMHIAEDVPLSMIASPEDFARAASFGLDETAEPIEFLHDDEAAARFYLDQALQTREGPASFGTLDPSDPSLVPSLAMESTQRQVYPDKTNTVVRFQQVRGEIPIFGSNAIVEITEDRSLVSIDADIVDPEELSEVDTVPDLSPRQARSRIARFARVRVKSMGALKPPTLTFFYAEEDNTWHLAYHFREVPAAPAEAAQFGPGAEFGGHGPGGSPREEFPEYDYLVDVNDGSVLYYYSSHPFLDVPSLVKGVDELDVPVQFWGKQNGTQFEMCDPIRNIKTFDLKYGNIYSAPQPTVPISSSQADWAATNKAAISAHWNAVRVYDFYKSVLKRDGVDDKGMELISIVNVVEKNVTPPVWKNAVWWKKRMWYGQDVDVNGNLRSLSRYLDVIAHELTHGITEFTSNLVYRNQSGALNESFSDIFGVIINNWYLQGEDSDVDTWDWRIGAGFRPDGRALRDLKDPASLGYPDHMNKFLKTSFDNGGVHSNSNIHNKAAYNVLVATDAQGSRVFTPREVAVLYYLTLTRLGPTADFKKVRRVLLDVTRTMWVGDPDEQARRVAAIEKAYDDVGIKL